MQFYTMPRGAVLKVPQQPCELCPKVMQLSHPKFKKMDNLHKFFHDKIWSHLIRHGTMVLIW